MIDPHALALLALLQVYCVFTGEQRVAGEIPGRPFALSRRSQSAGKKKPGDSEATGLKLTARLGTKSSSRSRLARR